MPIDSSPDSKPVRTRPSWLGALEVLFFIAGLITVERLTLARMSEGEAAGPGLLWQLLVPVFVSAFALLFHARGRRLVLGLTGLACATLAASDLAYHAFFGTVTSAYMASSFTQLVDVRTSVTNLVRPVDLLMTLPFLALIALGFAGDRVDRAIGQTTVGPTGWAPRFVPSVGLLALGLALSAIAWKTPIYEKTHHVKPSYWVTPAEHWGSQFSRLTYASTFGLFNYHVSDLANYLRSASGRESLAESKQDTIHATLDHKRQLNERTSPLFGVARGRHVILVQLESLQHFLLDLEVGGTEVTPTLNRVAKSALRWDYILDVTHLGRTSDAEFAVMTGLLPDVRKPIVFERLDPNLVTMPKTLGAAGYETSSIHAYRRSFWNRSYSHPLFGIDEMFFGEYFGRTTTIDRAPSDDHIFAFAAKQLEERRTTPQLEFIISLTSHHPYLAVPQKYFAKFEHLHPDQGYGLVAPYLASANYTDEAVGRFLEDLERRGLLEDSLIVLYGDHDRGGLGEQRPIPEVGPRMSQLSEDRVPFLIMIPGAEDQIAAVGERYQGVMGGLHDLFPTITHLLGLPVPDGIMGTHLFVENEHRDAIPLPGPSDFFGYRGALSLPGGRHVVSARAAEGATDWPAPEVVMRDRRVLEDLVDHYPTIVAAKGRAPAHALADAQSTYPLNPPRH